MVPRLGAKNPASSEGPNETLLRLRIELRPAARMLFQPGEDHVWFGETAASSVTPPGADGPRAGKRKARLVRELPTKGGAVNAVSEVLIDI